MQSKSSRTTEFDKLMSLRTWASTARPSKQATEKQDGRSGHETEDLCNSIRGQRESVRNRSMSKYQTLLGQFSATGVTGMPSDLTLQRSWKEIQWMKSIVEIYPTVKVWGSLKLVMNLFSLLLNRGANKSFSVAWLLVLPWWLTLAMVMALSDWTRLWNPWSWNYQCWWKS